MLVLSVSQCCSRCFSVVLGGSLLFSVVLCCSRCLGTPLQGGAKLTSWERFLSMIFVSNQFLSNMA